MTEPRESLEQRLLTDPFDLQARKDYSRLLLEEGSLEASLQQFEILQRQRALDGADMTKQALALWRLGRHVEALRLYSSAHHLPGFSNEPELDGQALVANTGRPDLRLIPGGRDEKIIELRAMRPVPTSFDDIVGLQDLKKLIRLQIIEPFRRPSLFEKFRKKAGGGVLLYGPPGCGKTMMARAVATECRARFMPVGISDVLNQFFGQSSQNLAALFDQARADTPCVLFFDELDALGYSRSKAQSEMTRQVVNEFLSQLDGLSGSNQDILVLAATNMPWDVDSAMKRPGRFSRQIFVPPPDLDARTHLIEMKLDGVPHDTVDARSLAARADHFSGADVEEVIELAKEYVLQDAIETGTERALTATDLERAIAGHPPSTLDWLRIARNLVRYAQAGEGYRDVETYLRKHDLY